jgi:hypothetical protein
MAEIPSPPPYMDQNIERVLIDQDPVLSEAARELFVKYSGIPEDQILEHVKKIVSCKLPQKIVKLGGGEVATANRRLSRPREPKRGTSTNSRVSPDTASSNSASEIHPATRTCSRGWARTRGRGCSIWGVASDRISG